MDDMLRSSHEMVTFRRDIENRLAQLDAEIYRLKMQRTIDAAGREMTFWFGMIFLTGLILVVAFARDWK